MKKTSRISSGMTMNLIENQFLPVFFSLPDPVFVIDHEGTILDANEAYGSLFSRSPQACIGNTVFRSLLPELAAKRLEQIHESLCNAKPFSWDDELDGRTLRNRAYPCIIPEGEAARLLIIVHDISDIGQELKKERVLTKTVIESIPGAFYVVNATGKFVFWNQFIRDQIVGKPEHEMNDAVGIDYIHPDDRPTVAENILKILQDNQELTSESRVLFHNGELFRWFLMTGKRIILDGNPLLIGAGVDITQRKQAEEEIIHQLQHMRALREIDLVIRGTTDIYLSLKTILDFTLSELHIDAADFLVLEPHMNTLKYVAGRGFQSKNIEHSTIKIGEGNTNHAELKQNIHHVRNLPDAGNKFSRAPFIKGEGFVEYYAISLSVKGNVNGLFEIFQRKPLELESSSLDFLQNLASQAAIAIDSYHLFSNLNQLNHELLLAYETTIEGWSKALDMRDNETEGHTQRVTNMVLELAHHARINDEELVHIKRGALLHDIGKMGIPDKILLKPGTLTDEEREIMRKHPVFAFQLLAPIAYLHPAMDIPYCHHEKWDGSGYPRGLKGDEIPFSARLFALVDVWDALSSDRPYRQRWAKENVLEHIKSRSGTDFDPKAVEFFLNLIKNEDTSEAFHESWV